MFSNRSLRVRTLLTLFLILCGWLPAPQPHLVFLSPAETAPGSGRVAHAQSDPPTTPPTDDAGSTIFLPLIANDATPGSVTTPTAAPEKAFAQQLQALATLLAEWEESVAAGSETAEHRTALAQSKRTLTDLDRQIRTNFTAREAKLRTAALPDLILERHLDSLQRHEAAWQTLLDLLTTLETTTDPNVLRTAIGRARDFLTGQQPQPLVQLPRNDDLASRKATVLPAVTFSAELPAVQAAATQALLSIPGNPPVAADLLPTIDLQLTPAITDLAASLGNSPLELYRYVKNNIAYEPYLGSRKGATATLAMQAGNSYDQASLLIALLRAAGIPARYVTGRAVVPAAQVNSWLGVDDVDAAAALFNMAGLQVQGYLMPGGQALEFNHIWVAAYLPYTNDRGGPDDTGQAQWIPLDPSMKTLELRPGLDIPAAMNFNATAFVDSYISTFHTLSPVELYLEQIEQYAATNHPTLTYPDDIIRQRRIVPDPLPQLPGSLPYLISSQSADFAEIPATQRYQIDFELRDSGGNTLFLYTADLPTIADKRVTLAYDPATSADQALLDLYGDLFATPPDLIYLMPVLRIGGVAVAQGGRVRPGDQQIMWHTFDPPNGEVIVGGAISHRSVAGEYHGIAFDPYRVHLGGVPSVSDTPDTDGLLGEQLYRTAMAYLDRQGQSWDLTADTMQVVYATSVAQAVMTNQLTVWYTLGGDPALWDPEGLSVDAQNKTVGGAFSVADGNSELIPFMTLVGADGSILENRVFEDLYGQEAISAVKVLALAADAQIPICVVTTGNLGDCSTIYQSAYLVAMMNLALTLGYEVVAPRDALTHHDWHGGGFIARDPVSKEGYWYIVEGGLNGGATVDNLDSWSSPWWLVFDNVFRELCATDPITANIIAPAADSYWPVQKGFLTWLFPNPWNLPGLYPVFDVEYTICFEGGTSTTVSRHYWPHVPYPAGDQTFNAGWGTTESLNFTMFDVEMEMSSDIYALQNNEPINLNANVIPRVPPGATFSWGKSSGSGDGTFSSASAQTVTFSGTVKGKVEVQVELSNVNGTVIAYEEVTVFEIKLADISFSGDHTIDKDGTGNITDPVWEDANGDGVPEKNESIAYTRNRNMTLTASFAVDPPVSVSGVTVKGTGAGGRSFSKSDIRLYCKKSR